MMHPLTTPSKGMLFLLSALFLLTVPHRALAQTLIDNSLPTCAQTCAQLQNAQDSCTPAGGAPVSNQQTYQSCFCQSALLSQLYSPQSIPFCTQCSTADMATIQSWYKTYCKGGPGKVVAGDASGSSAAPGGTSTAAGQPQATGTVTAVANNPSTTQGATVVGGNSNNNDPNAGKSWIEIHYKWVIMLVVLFLGLSLFAFIFHRLHRRYHARRAAAWSASSAPPPDINTWGPGQSVHDFGAYAASLKRSLSRGRGSRKGKSKDAAETGVPMREKSGGRGGGDGSLDRSHDKGKAPFVQTGEIGVAYGGGRNVPEMVPPVPAVRRDPPGGAANGRGYYGGGRAEEGAMF